MSARVDTTFTCCCQALLGHAGVGSISISSDMQAAAQRTLLWARDEDYAIYGNHPDYTLWSVRQLLVQGVTISIPCSRLRLAEAGC